MFKVGDTVVYPLHGAGTIESIEEQEVLGKKQRYYVLKLLIGGMRLMIPVDSAKKVGLRSIIRKGEANKVFDVLKGKGGKERTVDWKLRYNKNLEKIKSGSIYKVAEVARNLSARSQKQGLSSSERKLFDSACQMIVSELTFVQDSSLKEVNSEIEKILKISSSDTQSSG
jgi:CarD family transcriptional regulator